MDPYKILMVDIKTPADLIKQSYRDLSKRWHPDKLHGDAEKFKEIAEAYEILSDPEKKKMYDETGLVYNEKQMEKKAQELVHQVFKTLIGQYGMERILSMDVIAELKSLMDMGIQEVDKKIMEAKKEMAVAERVLGKFTFKEEHNPIKDLLEADIHRHEATIRQMKSETVIAKRTYSLLKNYKFQSDGAQFVESQFQTYTTSFTGFQ